MALFRGRKSGGSESSAARWLASQRNALAGREWAALTGNAHLIGYVNVEGGDVGIFTYGRLASECDGCMGMGVRCDVCVTPGPSRVVAPAGRGDGLYKVFMVGGDSLAGALVCCDERFTPNGHMLDNSQFARLVPAVVGELVSEGYAFVADSMAGANSSDAMLDTPIPEGRCAVVAWLANDSECGVVPLAVGVYGGPALNMVARSVPPLPGVVWQEWEDGSRLQHGNIVGLFGRAFLLNHQLNLALAEGANGDVDEFEWRCNVAASWALQAREFEEPYCGALRDMVRAGDGLSEIAADLLDDFDVMRRYLDGPGTAIGGPASTPQRRAALLGLRIQPDAAFRDWVIAAEQGDQTAQCEACWTALKMGDLGEAERLGLMAVSGPDPAFAATAVNNIVFSIYIPQERYSEARVLLQRAIDLQAGYQSVNALSNLGIVEYLEGNVAAAQSCFERAMRLDDGTRAEGLYYLAQMAADRGDYGARSRYMTELRDLDGASDYAKLPDPEPREVTRPTTSVASSPTSQEGLSGLGSSVATDGSGLFDGPPSWGEMLDLLRVRGTVTDWWQPNEDARRTSIRSLVPPSSDGTDEQWMLNPMFLPQPGPTPTLALEVPCEFRDRVRSTIESAGASLGQFTLPDGRCGLAGPWATALSSRVVHSAEFVNSSEGSRCLWTAQILASDDVAEATSAEVAERIALMMQQMAYMMEMPMRSGLLRLMNVSRDLIFPNTAPELRPRPLVHVHLNGHEVIDDGSGGYSTRPRGVVYRFGFEIDDRLSDSQLAEVLPVVVDSVTGCLTIMESGVGNTFHNTEGVSLPGLHEWLLTTQSKLELALQSRLSQTVMTEPTSQVSTLLRPSAEGPSLLKRSGTPFGLSSVSAGKGLPAQDVWASEPIDFGDDLGHNPFAIWPARTPDLAAALGSQDESVRAAAAASLASQGDGDAMVILGVLAQERSDDVGARSWFEQATLAGSPAGMGHLAAYMMDSDTQNAAGLFVSAALCGNGRARTAVAAMARATAGGPDPLPSGLGILEDPSWIASFISSLPESFGRPALLPLYRRSAELGWPGSLGTITWWTLLEGQVQLGLEQGYELMPMVSVNSPGNDPASWAYQVGNARSNMAFLRLCDGEDAALLARELPMWSGKRGQMLAPTELFLIPLIARARSGDLAGARSEFAGWSSTDVDDCRGVAAEMAIGTGPIVTIADEIRALFPA